MKSAGWRVVSWNFPDLYGGIATDSYVAWLLPGSNHLGTSLICAVGLRLLLVHEANLLQGCTTWNFPDLYGGIATSGPWDRLTNAFQSWNFPDLYDGIATPRAGRPDHRRDGRRNYPDLYGGIATDGGGSGWISSRRLGTSLICMVGLRLTSRRILDGRQLNTTWNFPDLYGGIATMREGSRKLAIRKNLELL